MERASLFFEFKQILAEHVSAKQTKALENLQEQTNLIDELGIESLDIVNIVIDMEDRFNIEIDNDSIRRMSTVGNCLDLLQEKCCAHCTVACRA
jgi:acyl carrier protein